MLWWILHFELLWTLLHLTLNHCIGNSLILTQQQQQFYLIRSFIHGALIDACVKLLSNLSRPLGMNRRGVEEIMTYTIELITVSLLGWQDSCASVVGWVFPQLALQRWLLFRYLHVKVVVLCQMATCGLGWAGLFWFPIHVQTADSFLSLVHGRLLFTSSAGPYWFHVIPLYLEHPCNRL